MDTQESTDRLPPQSIEAEQDVLGCLLVQSEMLAQVSHLLQPEFFYKKSHQAIYEAILKLQAAGQPISAPTVAQQLKESGQLTVAGERLYLGDLAASHWTTTTAVFNARVIRKEWYKRKLADLGERLQEEARKDDSDPLELHSQLAAHVQSARAFLADRPQLGIANAVEQLKSHTLELIQKRLEDPNYLPGIKTGFPKLDDHLLGLQQAELIIIGGRPGMGKTATAISLAMNIALFEKKHLAIFSLEMKEEALIRRMVTRQTTFTNQALHQKWLRNGTLGEHQKDSFFAGCNRLQEAPITIIDEQRDRCSSIHQIERWARRLSAQEHPPEVLFIDHFHLIAHDEQELDEQEKLADISKRLKRLAKELNIPVVLLCQLNRGAETRGSHRPTLGDLRQCGALEQDADVVLLLYRAEYYDNLQNKPTEPNDKDKLEVIIAKHREGEQGLVRLGFDGARCNIFPLKVNALGQEVPEVTLSMEKEKRMTKQREPEPSFMVDNTEVCINPEGEDWEVWTDEECRERASKAIARGDEDFEANVHAWHNQQTESLARADWATKCITKLLTIYWELKNQQSKPTLNIFKGVNHAKQSANSDTTGDAGAN